jgi:hypothetical protein
MLFGFSSHNASTMLSSMKIVARKFAKKIGTSESSKVNEGMPAFSGGIDGQP